MGAVGAFEGAVASVGVVGALVGVGWDGGL